MIEMNQNERLNFVRCASFMAKMMQKYQGRLDEDDKASGEESEALFFLPLFATETLIK